MLFISIRCWKFSTVLKIIWYNPECLWFWLKQEVLGKLTVSIMLPFFWLCPNKIWCCCTSYVHRDYFHKSHSTDCTTKDEFTRRSSNVHFDIQTYSHEIIDILIRFMNKLRIRAVFHELKFLFYKRKMFKSKKTCQFFIKNFSPCRVAICKFDELQDLKSKENVIRYEIDCNHKIY